MARDLCFIKMLAPILFLAFVAPSFAQNFTLFYSANPSPFVPNTTLDGATDVPGNLYVYMFPEGPNISTVLYYVDGNLFNTENTAPYELDCTLFLFFSFLFFSFLFFSFLFFSFPYERSDNYPFPHLTSTPLRKSLTCL
jgi:hypothetical protein